MKKGGKKQKSNAKHFFNIIDWLFIAVAIITTIIALITNHQHSLSYIIADIVTLIAGVFYMLLTVKGYRSGFIFSILTTIGFIYVVWYNQLYGNAIISMCYIPFAFVGYYLWGKHSNKKKEVEARKLTPIQIALVAITIIISTIVLKLILDAVGGASTFLDSVTVATTFIANVLVFLRYREQWLVWLLVDVLQLILWVTTNDPIMIVLRILYPLSAIYGYIYWQKLVKSPRSKKKNK